MMLIPSGRFMVTGKLLYAIALHTKTRAGGTCLVRVEFRKARCRFHGGLSTGPKTEAGRAWIAEAQRRRWRVYREAQRDRQPAEVKAEAERHATQGHLCGTQGSDHRD